MDGTAALLARLRSKDWAVASQAAHELASVDGERVTVALVAALDAHDTAITDAAMEALVIRDDLAALEQVWTALCELGDDVTDQMWDVISEYKDGSELAATILRRDANG